MTLPLELTTLVVDVLGTPVPQGSMIAVRRGRRTYVVPDNASELKHWRNDVAKAASARMTLTRWLTADCPVAVRVDFWLPRPAAAVKRMHPHVRPDIDKLVRAVLDACTTASVWTDDARVVALQAWKHYAVAQCGARITIEAL